MDEEVFVSLCDKSGFERLDLWLPHIFALKELTRLEDAPRHNDPFDRILIAQAKTEEMTMITHDGLLAGYGEECVLTI